jgi:hypothetical protein
MHRGSRIGLTIVAGSLLLLLSLVLLAVGAVLGHDLDGGDCVVPDQGEGFVPWCLDDELTGRATAKVLDVDPLVDPDHPRREPPGSGYPLERWYQVTVSFRAGGEQVVTDVDVLQDGRPPAAGGTVTVAYTPEDPGYSAALAAELDRVHALPTHAGASPEAGSVLLGAGIAGALAVLVAIFGGVWAGRGIPKPRRPDEPGRGFPPGRGPPTGQPVPGQPVPGQPVSRDEPVPPD